MGLTSEALKFTVYPPEDLYPVIGDTGVVYNEALVGWAQVIEVATAENDHAFTPEEWHLLARALRGEEVAASMPQPGALLALLYRTATKNPLPGLAEKLAALPYQRAWALLLTLRYFEKWRAGKKVDDHLEWWTLFFRRETFVPRTITKRGKREKRGKK